MNEFLDITTQMPNDDYMDHIFFSEKMNKLNDEQIAELLVGDVSDIEDFNENEDINTDNLDELLLNFDNRYNQVGT